MWSITGQDETEVLFKITCPSGAVVDIIIEARLYEANDAVAGGDAPTGATPGVLYGNYLDGLTSGLLTPQNGNVPLP
jgi:hypothetical protein